MEPDYTQSSTSKQKHWRKQILCWKKSGLTQQEYCLSQGMAISTFSYWKRKLGNVAESPRPTSFYALTIKGTSTSSDKKRFDTGIRLSLCNDKFKIDLDKEFSETTLKKLITTLETI